MEFHVITLFPEMFESPFRGGMIGRAIEQSLLAIKTHPLREHGLGNYRQVDDAPYGGGSGMVMRPEPIASAIDAVNAERPGLWRILMTPQGEVFDNSMARDLAKRAPGLMIVAGRYEGIDERVRSLVDQEISIGDYVLSGGELGAAVIVDVVTRLIPGAVGNEASTRQESFTAADGIAGNGPSSTCVSGGLLDYPHYTRPAEFRGMAVPEVLVNGNHDEIRRWRRRRALEKTLRNRPDLIEAAELSEEDRQLLAEIRR
jgi:tRNA (guanine37-N1)-methyltransferase